MRCQIKTTSQYAKAMLNQGGCKTVHSVYNKTINLSIGKGLISIQPFNSPQTPISLITDLSKDVFDQMEIETGSRVYITKDEVILLIEQQREYRFNHQNANTVDLTLSQPLSFDRARMIKSYLEMELYRDNTNGFRTVFFPQEGSKDCLITAEAKRWIAAAEKAAEKEHWEAAAKNLTQLVGLGIGLTPSGDDFLCGFLAGMTLGNNRDHPLARCLRLLIPLNLTRTNDISRSFLQCAAEEQFGAVIHSFYTAPPDKILDDMRRIGHSSGIDTLCGILYSLQVFEGGKSEKKGQRQEESSLDL